MLILTWRIGETGIIGQNTAVTVLGVKGEQVRVGTGADSAPCRAMIPRDVRPPFHSTSGHRSTASRAG